MAEPAISVALAAAAHARGLSRAEFQAWWLIVQTQEPATSPLDAYDLLLTMEPVRNPPQPPEEIENPVIENPEEITHEHA